MFFPGSPESLVTSALPGEDYLVKEIADLKRSHRELLAAVASGMALLPRAARGVPAGTLTASATPALGATTQIVVPVGFSRCTYAMVATAGASASAAGNTALQVRCALSVNGSAYLDSLDLSSDNPTRLSVFVPANAGTSVSSASSGLLAGLDDGDILDFQSFHVESIPANVAAGSIGAGVNVTALFMR